MDYAIYGFIAGSIGVVFAVVASVLYWMLFKRTGHGAEWALVAMLPVSGLLVAPVLSASFLMGGGFGETVYLINTILMQVSGSMFNFAPLAILVWRFVTGRVVFNVFT